MTDPASSNETKERGFAGLADLLSDVSGHETASVAREPTVSISADQSIAVPLAPSPLQAAPSKPEKHRLLLPIVVFAVAAMVGSFLYRQGSERNGEVSQPTLPPTPQVAETSSPPQPEVEPSAPLAPTLAVAALSANVRKDATASSKSIAVLSRGTPIEQLETINGFVKFQLPGGREGWISRDVAIPRAEAVRLNGLSASDYVKARAPLRGIDSLLQQLHQFKDLFAMELYLVANESQNLDAKLAEVAATVHVSVPADTDAATWYSLEAKAFADRGMRAEAVESARAAVFADPTNVDAHVALAFAAFKTGDLETVNAVATVLPLLAPNATNTWVVMGISAANMDMIGVPAGAFALALRKSRNSKVTTKVLADLAKVASDPKVSIAIEAALTRWESNR